MSVWTDVLPTDMSVWTDMFFTAFIIISMFIGCFYSLKESINSEMTMDLRKYLMKTEKGD